MSEKPVLLDFLPQPDKLSSSDIALLTQNRQSVIVCLAHGNRTLSELATEINLQTSTVFECLEVLEKSKIIQKGEGKLYSLTTKGKFLSFMLLKPNGQTEMTIRTLFDKFLKEDLKIDDSEYRKTLVDRLREAI